MKALENKMLLKHGTPVRLICLTPVEEESFERQVMTKAGLTKINVGVMVLTLTVDGSKLKPTDFIPSKDGSTTLGAQTHRMFACKFRHPDTGKIIYLIQQPRYEEFKSRGATFCSRERWEQLKALLQYSKGCDFPLPGACYGKIKFAENKKDPTAPPANYLETWGGPELMGRTGPSLMDEDEGEVENEAPQGGLMDEDEHQEQAPQTIQQAAAAAAQAAPTPPPAAPASTPQQQAPAPAPTTGKPRRGQQAAS